MNPRIYNFNPRQLTQASGAAALFVRLGLLFLFAAYWPHSAAASTVASVSISRGLPFAVADFDGDHQPDLASVQTGAAGSSDYLVAFRLSELGRRYLRITGPKGGLIVEARDVNGDRVPDLVVASAWLDKPVAIFLNDGHGNFSQVNPSAFPRAFATSDASWNSYNNRHSCAVALPRSSSSGEIQFASGTERILQTKEFLRFQSVRLASVRPMALSAGRAPPAALLS
jgi:hypothetical protein